MDILSIKNMLLCSKHKNRAASFIQIASLNEEDKQIFYCDICIMSNKTKKLSNFILIQDIIDASENTFIDYWPPLEDETIYQEIASLRSIQDETLQQRICSYFDELKTKLIAKIDEIKKKLLKDSFIEMFPSSLAENMNKLIEIQKLKDFQNIFKDINTTSTQKEQQYTEFINTFHNEKKQNTQRVRELLCQIQYENQLFGLEKPLQIQKQLLDSIEKIVFKKNRIDIFPYFNFYKSKCNEISSSGIDLSKLQNKIEISSPNNNYFGSYYSNFVLNPDFKYVFTVKFDRESRSDESFSIGLVQDKNKDKYQSYNERLNCSFFFNSNFSGHCPGAGIDKVVRGNMSFYSSYSSNVLDLRICIKDQILEIIDKEKDAKICIDEQYKKLLTPENVFRLSIYVQYQIKVSLLSAEIVQDFDEDAQIF